jgi:hypothetical protein
MAARGSPGVDIVLTDTRIPGALKGTKTSAQRHVTLRIPSVSGAWPGSCSIVDLPTDGMLAARDDGAQGDPALGVADRGTFAMPTAALRTHGDLIHIGALDFLAGTRSKTSSSPASGCRRDTRVFREGTAGQLSPLIAAGAAHSRRLSWLSFRPARRACSQ